MDVEVIKRYIAGAVYTVALVYDFDRLEHLSGVTILAVKVKRIFFPVMVEFKVIIKVSLILKCTDCSIKPFKTIEYSAYFKAVALTCFLNLNTPRTSVIKIDNSNVTILTGNFFLEAIDICVFGSLPLVLTGTVYRGDKSGLRAVTVC